MSKRKMIFKRKICKNCSSEFTPLSGVQALCGNCIRVCDCCKTPIPKYSRSNLCQKCSAKSKRKFSRICKECNIIFFDSNNKTIKCDACRKKENKGNCKTCGIKISKKAFSCNSCRAKASPPNTSFLHRYEFNGIKYRSSWELEFAKLLNEFNVSFEYEKYCKDTKNFPDFYILELGVYVEIHPDIHGEKRLPINCFLIKTLAAAKTMAILIAWMIDRKSAKEKIEKFKKAKIGHSIHNLKNIINYLQAEIMRLKNNKAKNN